jgi:hypothetical protein
MQVSPLVRGRPFIEAASRPRRSGSSSPAHRPRAARHRGSSSHFWRASLRVGLAGPSAGGPSSRPGPIPAGPDRDPLAARPRAALHRGWRGDVTLRKRRVLAARPRAALQSRCRYQGWLLPLLAALPWAAPNRGADPAAEWRSFGAACRPCAGCPSSRNRVDGGPNRRPVRLSPPVRESPFTQVRCPPGRRSRVGCSPLVRGRLFIEACSGTRTMPCCSVRRLPCGRPFIEAGQRCPGRWSGRRSMSVGGRPFIEARCG